MKSKDKYYFSIIMPLYNVEDYLEEAIDSVVGQTVGFENIQLILINDGSTDGTEAICRHYQKKFPDNIIYVKKDNGGVSSARNKGLRYVKGKYVNFFDGDDRWEKTSFSRAFEFFEKHYDEIDILVCRMKYFERNEDKVHPLDYKFEYNRIVNLMEEYDQVQAAIGNTFIKAEALTGRTFNTRLTLSEDTLLLTQITLEKNKHGILKDAVYYYRKTGNQSTLSGSCFLKKSWYLDVPQYFSLEILRLAKQKYGYVPMYIQYLVMYELQWHRDNRGINDTLTKAEQDEYKALIIKVLQELDDKVIASVKNIGRAYKLFFFNLKYGKNVLEDAVLTDEGKLNFNNDVLLYNLKNRGACDITILEMEGNELILEGKSNIAIMGGKFNLFIKDENGKYYELRVSPFIHADQFAFTGEKIFEGLRFRVSVPIKKTSVLTVVARNAEGVEVIARPSFGKFAGLNGGANKDVKSTYCIQGEYIFKYYNSQIHVFPNVLKRRIACEVRYLKKLHSLGKIQIIKYRLLYHCAKLFSRKPIWILSDRIFKAGDNGESLFKHIVSTEINKQNKVYFVFDKNSPDYQRLKTMGRVLDPKSLKYKICFLLADKIISSHADEAVINPFGTDKELLKNLFHFDFVYLQHGVTPGNLSSWLHKLNKNIKLMMTSARREQESLIGGDYYYTDQEIKLTGAPRHDDIKHQDIKKVAFLPTWRENLAGKMLKGDRDRAYSLEFKHSSYCQHYNRLINDERIIKAMKTAGFHGEFYVHPALRQQIRDFHGNDTISVGQDLADYDRLISESAMIVTDYSSVTFDFAYLRKRILYTQFDSKQYWQEHFYEKGYFDYERDGFGPVCYDYESTVQGIVDAIEENCVNPQKYMDRCNDFFQYHDKLNSRRALEAILEM